VIPQGPGRRVPGPESTMTRFIPIFPPVVTDTGAEIWNLAIVEEVGFSLYVLDKDKKRVRGSAISLLMSTPARRASAGPLQFFVLPETPLVKLLMERGILAETGTHIGQVTLVDVAQEECSPVYDCHGCKKSGKTRDAWRWEQDNELYCPACREGLDDTVAEPDDAFDAEPFAEDALERLAEKSQRPPRGASSPAPPRPHRGPSS